MQTFLIRSLLRIKKCGFVLAGHGYTANRLTDPDIETQHRPLASLIQAVEALRGLGLHFISFDELLRLVQTGFKSAYPWVHLTFDDGYQNQFSTLYPFLVENHLPFSLFVSTYHIQRQEWFYHDRLRCASLQGRGAFQFEPAGAALPAGAGRSERLQFSDQLSRYFLRSNRQEIDDLFARVEGWLSPGEWRRCAQDYAANTPLSLSSLQEMAQNPLVNIGCHNHHHINLNPNLSENDARAEIASSKDWLVKYLGIQPLAYSYPNGKHTDFTPHAKAFCHSAGFQAAFTTFEGAVSAGTDPLEIPRIGLPANRALLERKLLVALLPGRLVQTLVFLKHLKP